MTPTPPHPGTNGSGTNGIGADHPARHDPARLDAVAALAREVDGLRRAVDVLAPVPGRVDDLARLVAQLTDALDALTRRQAAPPVPSWLLAPADPTQAAATLRELCGWLGAVYLRYGDAAAGLPECWCWHGEVVEELLWLMHAWVGAYQGATASVQLVGDWHDRQRPGVVRRVRGYAGGCSIEAHQIRPGWTRVPSGAPTVPDDAELDAVAAWWGPDRDHPAPEPPPRRGGAIAHGLGGGRR